MVFIFPSIRVARNTSCLFSPFKLSVATYSTKAVSSAKALSSSQRHRRIVAVKDLQSATISPSVTVPHDRQRITVHKDLTNDIQKDVRIITEPEWRSMELDSGKIRKYCLMLSKIRLTSLVVVTTMAGYSLAPGPFDISTFIISCVGTGLLSATANAINQFFEVPFDSQMSRTKNRVLVRGYLTPAHAITFAAASGIGGLALLCSQVNGLTAALGATNLILYTLIYTPMKRVSILNTWVGSIVGAIPPLMGWAACVGDITSPGAWIMPCLLYAWQFPHFNALSWNLRPDYSRAGYRMMAVTDPHLCRKTTVRYTTGLMGLCYLAPALDVTSWWFAVTSTPLNAYFLYLAWKFHNHSDSANSRKLFRFSLIHLPMLMVFMLINKKHWFNEKTHTEKKDTMIREKERSDIYTILTKFIATTSPTV